MSRRYILKRLPRRWLCEPCCISYDLRGLPPGSISEGAEIRHVVDAWLTDPTASIAAHIPSSCQPVDPLVEGVSRRHILEYLRVGIFREAGSIAHDFGELSSGYLVVRSEGAIAVATHHTITGQAADKSIEGGA